MPEVAMSRRVLLGAFLLLVVVLAGSLFSPGVRWCVWRLRGESFYRGRPTSYYRETLKRPYGRPNGWYFYAPHGFWGVMAPPPPWPLESRPQVAAVYRRLGHAPGPPEVVFDLAEADRVLPVLTELFQDRDAVVAVHAATILREMGPLARPAVPALVAAFEHPRDGRVRQAAADALLSVDRGTWAKVVKEVEPHAAAEAGVGDGP
jgi:HEAT repeats